MVGYRKCAISGCDNKDAPRHRFPNPAKYMDNFKNWMQASGNSQIENMDADNVYRSHRICHIHFTENDISSNTFLKRHAIPSLFLKEFVHINCPGIS